MKPASTARATAVKSCVPCVSAALAVGADRVAGPLAGPEPGAGRQTAKRNGSDWTLTGTKVWITNGTIADVATVWARTGDGQINGFLVEKGMPGFEAPEMHHKMSLRASVTSELVLKDVRVPEESRLPAVSSLRGPPSCLTEARYGIVWGADRAARACPGSAPRATQGARGLGQPPPARRADRWGRSPPRAASLRPIRPSSCPTIASP